MQPDRDPGLARPFGGPGAVRADDLAPAVRDERRPVGRVPGNDLHAHLVVQHRGPRREVPQPPPPREMRQARGEPSRVRVAGPVPGRVLAERQRVHQCGAVPVQHRREPVPRHHAEVRVAAVPGRVDDMEERRGSAARPGRRDGRRQPLRRARQPVRCHAHGRRRRRQRRQHHRIDPRRVGQPVHRVHEGAVGADHAGPQYPTGRRTVLPSRTVRAVRTVRADRAVRLARPARVHHAELRALGPGAVPQPVAGAAVHLPAVRPEAQQVVPRRSRDRAAEEGQIGDAGCLGIQHRPLPAAGTLDPGIGRGQQLPVRGVRARSPGRAQQGVREDTVPAPVELPLVRELIEPARGQQQVPRSDLGQFHVPRHSLGRIPRHVLARHAPRRLPFPPPRRRWREARGRARRLRVVPGGAAGVAAVQHRHHMGAAARDLAEQCAQPLVEQRAVRADQRLVPARRLDQQVRARRDRLGAVPGEPEERRVPRARGPQERTDAVLHRRDRHRAVEQDPHPGGAPGAVRQEPTGLGDVVDAAGERLGDVRRVGVDARHERMDRPHGGQSASRVAPLARASRAPTGRILGAIRLFDREAALPVAELTQRH